MKALLFAYGTLRSEEVQRVLFGRKLDGIRDVLTGYAIGKIMIEEGDPTVLAPQSFYPIAIPSGNLQDQIEGMIYEISEQEIKLADTYEGESYQRIVETFSSGRSAWIYIKA